MSLARLFVPIVFVLSGCAGPEAGFGPTGWPWPFAQVQGQAAQAAGAAAIGGYAQFSFDWQLSGDPEIMPVQVFDDGARMWLQFSPEGAWPAVFDVGAAGWRPLSYRRDSPYMVLDGIHEHLQLRGGHLRGSVRRAGELSQTGSAAGQAAAAPAVSAAEPASASAVQELELSARTETPLAGPDRKPSTDGGLRLESGAAPGTEVVTTDRAGDSAAGLGGPRGLQKHSQPPVSDYLGAPISRYAVSPADHTIRQALERWASKASWTFSAEHWAVDVDIPLVGDASFETDFKSAVRELLASTEMGDRPLQPCFYSNRVLRVVPYAQACDRRGGTRTVS